MKVRWLAVALTVAAIGVAACGDDGTAQGEEHDGAIVINTHVKIGAAEELRGSDISGGEVLDGSSIGDSPFCSGGTFRDTHSEDPEIGFVDRRFDCPDGSLRIGFSPGPPPTPLTQSGPWHVVSGTGAFEGLEGDGQMEIEYEPHTEATEGGETFTGTVAR